MGWGRQHNRVGEHQAVKTQPHPHLPELGQGWPQLPYLFCPERLTGPPKGPTLETGELRRGARTSHEVVVLWPGTPFLLPRKVHEEPSFSPPLLKSHEAAERKDRSITGEVTWIVAGPGDSRWRPIALLPRENAPSAIGWGPRVPAQGRRSPIPYILGLVSGAAPEFLGGSGLGAAIYFGVGGAARRTCSHVGKTDILSRRKRNGFGKPLIYLLPLSFTAWAWARAWVCSR